MLVITQQNIGNAMKSNFVDGIGKAIQSAKESFLSGVNQPLTDSERHTIDELNKITLRSDAALNTYNQNARVRKRKPQ